MFTASWYWHLTTMLRTNNIQQLIHWPLHIHWLLRDFVKFEVSIAVIKHYNISQVIFMTVAIKSVCMFMCKISSVNTMNDRVIDTMRNQLPGHKLLKRNRRWNFESLHGISSSLLLCEMVLQYSPVQYSSSVLSPILHRWSLHVNIYNSSVS